MWRRRSSAKDYIWRCLSNEAQPRDEFNTDTSNKIRHRQLTSMVTWGDMGSSILADRPIARLNERMKCFGRHEYRGRTGIFNERKSHLTTVQMNQWKAENERELSGKERERRVA